MEAEEIGIPALKPDEQSFELVNPGQCALGTKAHEFPNFRSMFFYLSSSGGSWLELYPGNVEADDLENTALGQSSLPHTLSFMNGSLCRFRLAW